MERPSKLMLPNNLHDILGEELQLVSVTMPFGGRRNYRRLNDSIDCFIDWFFLDFRSRHEVIVGRNTRGKRRRMLLSLLLQ
jgi:hypothetical protein